MPLFGLLTGLGIAGLVWVLMPHRSTLEAGLRARMGAEADTEDDPGTRRRALGGRFGPGPGWSAEWERRIGLAGVGGALGSPERLMTATVSLGVGALVLVLILSGNVLAALIAGGVAGVLPWLWVDRRAAAAASRLHRLVPAFIEGVGAALATEGNIQQAVLRIATVTPEPLGPLVRSALGDTALSRKTLAQAMGDVGATIHSPELVAFAQAVEVAERERGTQDDHVMEQVILGIARRFREREAQVIRRRRELNMAMSVYNLFLVVTGLALLYSLINPSTSHVLLTTALGHMVLGLSVVSLPGTFVVMRALTSSGDITARRR